MHFYYITFRSVTFAQRGENLLSRQGFRCRILRTPRWMEEQGCGYALKLWTDDLARAMGLLRKHQIPLRRVYRQTEEDQMEEVYL